MGQYIKNILGVEASRKLRGGAVCPARPSRFFHPLMIPPTHRVVAALVVARGAGVTAVGGHEEQDLVGVHGRHRARAVRAGGVRLVLVEELEHVEAAQVQRVGQPPAAPLAVDDLWPGAWRRW